MGRPRKNRLGEYATLLAAELSTQLGSQLAHALEESARANRAEVAQLRAELRALARQVEAIGKRSRPGKARIGKWVPGGPGRPPKDAADRIAAFEARVSAQAPPRAARGRGRARPSRE